MLPQSGKQNELLEERLRGQGVVVERQVELITFTARGDGVDAVLKHADGKEESVTADWLLGPDERRWCATG